MLGRQIINPNELTPGLRVTVKDGRAPVFTVESNSPPGSEMPSGPSPIGVAFLRDDDGLLHHLIYVETPTSPRYNMWGTLAGRGIYEVTDGG